MASEMTRWEPTRDLLRGRFDRLFDNFFEDVFQPLTGREGTARTGWYPAVDIQETQDEFTFLAELPGLTTHDVDVSLENGVLTLSGERKLEKNVDRDSYHRIERAYGRFTRSFRLPDNVKANDVKASFKNGILEIHVPKAEETKPRKIEIK